jgi:solute carrier family 25 (mitochondrial S-adenosylmethionine transporter), member 26
VESSSSTIAVLRQLKHNPTRLWRGYSALVARDLPFTALQFPAFEYLRKVLIERRSSLKKAGKPVTGVLERAWISALSAGVAGSAAAWVTTPFDVIKTRMMLEAGVIAPVDVEHHPGCRLQPGDVNLQRRRKRNNAFQIGMKALQREGIRGLFRGGLIRTVFTFLGNGIFMGCYEGAKVYLTERNKAMQEDKL